MKLRKLDVALVLAASASLLARRRAPDLVLIATTAATVGVLELGGERVVIRG